jgi:membrane protease YdiL (CAAX protease family)
VSAFRWLLVPELGLGALGILWASLSDGAELQYRFGAGVVLAALGLTCIFTAFNFGLFFSGHRFRVATAVYDFLEGAIFPLVRQATLFELLLGAAMAGFSEELLFRGLLQPQIGLVASSLLFGLLHGPSRSLWPLAAWAAVAGYILGLLHVTSENLLLPTLVHAFYDALALVYVRYFWRPRRLGESPAEL